MGATEPWASKLGEPCLQRIAFDLEAGEAVANARGFVANRVLVRQYTLFQFSRSTLPDRRDSAQVAPMVPDSAMQGDSVREPGGRRHPGGRLWRACSSPPVALRSNV